MEPCSLESTQSRSVDTSGAPPKGDRLQLLLLQLWMTSKTAIAERLETICRAQTMLEKNSLDEPTRSEAQDAAHNLAGVLGTFGLPVGTDLARQIEAMLEQASEPGAVDARSLAVTLDQLCELINQKSAEIPSP